MPTRKEPLTIKIPPGTQSGALSATARSGHAPARKSRPGDQFVRVIVDIPKSSPPNSASFCASSPKRLGENPAQYDESALRKSLAGDSGYPLLRSSRADTDNRFIILGPEARHACVVLRKKAGTRSTFSMGKIFLYQGRIESCPDRVEGRILTEKKAAPACLWSSYFARRW